jgi:hypothetical protein
MRTLKLWLRALVGEFGDAAADRKAARSATIEYSTPIANRCLLQLAVRRRPYC